MTPNHPLSGRSVGLGKCVFSSVSFILDNFIVKILCNINYTYAKHSSNYSSVAIVEFFSHLLKKQNF